MRVLPFALLAITLTGCNTAYRLPEGATQTAKVRFFSPETARVANSLAIYSLTSPDQCMDAKKLRVLGGWQMGGMSANEVDIGMRKNPQTLYEKNMYVEVPVVAEKRFNFALQGLDTGKVCHLTMSFLPKADRQYEVSYRSDRDKCYGAIRELISVGDEVMLSPEPSAELNEKTCKMFWN